MKNNIIKRIGTLFIIAIIACSSIFIIPGKYVQAAPAGASGDWNEYMSIDWLNPSDSRYSGYGSHEVGSSENYPYLIKTAGELAGFGMEICFDDGNDWGYCGILGIDHMGLASDMQYGALHYYDFTTDDWIEFDWLFPNGLAGRYIRLVPDSGVIDLSAHYWNPISIYGYDDGNGPAWGDGNPADIIHIDGNGTLIGGMNVIEGANIGTVNDYNDCLRGDDFIVSTTALFSYLYRVDISDIHFSLPNLELVFNDVDNFQIAGTLAAMASDSSISRIYVNNLQIHESINNEFEHLSNSIGGAVGVACPGTVTKEVNINSGQIDVEIGNYTGLEKGYIGGVIGYQFNGILHSSYADIDINYFSTTDNGENYIGGLVGFSSAFQAAEMICVLNSYSRVNISAEITNDTALLIIGGLIGQLDDSAINNYYYGNIKVIANNDSVIKGALFGSVGNWYDYVDAGDGSGYNDLTSDDSDFHILGNYYDPVNNNISSVGMTDQLGWGAIAEPTYIGWPPTIPADYIIPTSSPEIPKSAISAIESSESLLTKLEVGRQTVIAHYPHGELTNAQLEQRVSHWCIFDGVNDGLPTFGANCGSPVMPLPPDTGLNIRSIASIIGFTIVAIGAAMIISKKRSIKQK